MFPGNRASNGGNVRRRYGAMSCVPKMEETVGVLVMIEACLGKQDLVDQEAGLFAACVMVFLRKRSERQGLLTESFIRGRGIGSGSRFLMVR